MNHWDIIRSKARVLHAIVYAAANSISTATALLDAAAHITGVECIPVPGGDGLLDGGEAVLDREAGVIWYNADFLLIFYNNGM